MGLRLKAVQNNNRRLADTYLMIAAASEFNTLKKNFLQLCNLLFLNMLLIEARSCSRRSSSDKRQYRKLRRKEEQIRHLLRKKI